MKTFSKFCEVCGVFFNPKVPDKKYCSRTCLMKNNWVDRKKNNFSVWNKNLKGMEYTKHYKNGFKSNFEKYHIPWNKYLTKETDERLKLQGEKHSIFMTGRKQTPESNEKRRIATIKRIEDGTHNFLHMSKDSYIKSAKTRSKKWIENPSTHPCYKKEFDHHCIVCGCFFHRPNSDSGTNQFCSRQCKGKYLRGDKCSYWKGGIYNSLRELISHMDEYKSWRKTIFNRDNYMCQNCGIHSGYLHCHHIKSFNKIIKQYNIKNELDARGCIELWDINNGITLCKQCHIKTNNFGGRA